MVGNIDLDNNNLENSIFHPSVHLIDGVITIKEECKLCRNVEIRNLSQESDFLLYENFATSFSLATPCLEFSDIHGMLFLSMKSLKCLDLVHDQWIILQNNNNNNNNLSKKRNRYYKVCYLSELDDLTTNGNYENSSLPWAFLTHLSYYNFIRENNLNPNYKMEIIVNTSGSPFNYFLDLIVASKVNISVVASPFYFSLKSDGREKEIDEELKKYFKTNRLMSLNDLFFITLEDLLSDEPGMLFFSVREAWFNGECILNSKHSSFYINCENSQLFLNERWIESFICPILTSDAILFNEGSRLYQELDALLKFIWKKKKNSSRSYKILIKDTQDELVLERLILALSSNQGIHSYKLDFTEILSSDRLYDDRLKNSLENYFKKNLLSTPSIVFVSGIELSYLNETQDDTQNTNQAELFTENCLHSLFSKVNQFEQSFDLPFVFVVIISRSECALEIKRQFDEIFSYSKPDLKERRHILKVLTRSLLLAPDINLENLAHGMEEFDISDIEKMMMIVRRSATKTQPVCEDLIQKSLLHHRQMIENDLPFIAKVPNISWSDIGGLEEYKDVVRKYIQWPIQHQELYNDGLARRSGILLYGPPGTGKTLLAKAMATECSLHFLSVKGPELLNMYIGESERNIRDLFVNARKVMPSLIFFDEIDALAPSRGETMSGSGSLDRVTSSLLAELDALTSTDLIFVVAATNRLDLLDPALFRPGRFNISLPFGLASDYNTVCSILKSLTKKFLFDAGEPFLLEEIAKNCRVPISGAELYGLCSSAYLNCIQRKIKEINERRLPHFPADRGVVKTEIDDDSPLTVKKVDFLQAMDI